MMLVLLVALPLLGAILVAFSPEAKAKWIALAGTLAPVGAFLWVANSFQWWSGVSGDQLSHEFPWFPSLGLSFSFGVDAVSMLLIGLTILLGPICVLASFTAITPPQRVKTYYAWLLALQGAMTGVFMARDVVLFYVFFEFTLVPMYVLINLFGSTNRRAAATKFFLYTFTGSLVTLAGLVYLAYAASTGDHASGGGVGGAGGVGGWTFEFSSLERAGRELPLRAQSWVFWALLAGFAVKVPLFPVHTWLPLAHTEAPTAGSVVLAGVLLKLGTYGIYRFAIGFLPAAALEWAPVMAVLAIIGILYAGLICWVQTDVKKLVAYSSVSHLGFCVLGLFALNGIGLSGSVLYMINHGLSTGALFLLIGMIYERYHTRSMKELGGLAARMPIWATFMVFFTMASVGLPGTNGFVSEFMCLLGAFQAGGREWAEMAGSNLALPGATFGALGPWYAFVAGIGMIVTAIYLLYMLGRVVWGPVVEPGGHGHAHGNGHGHAAPEGVHSALPRDLTGREIGLLIPLAVLCLGLGLYPRPLLRVLEGPTRDMAAYVQQAAEASRTALGAPPAPGSGGDVTAGVNP